MSTAYLVLLILFIIYVPIWVWAWLRPEAAAKWHLQKYGPCLMIRTKLGMHTMDRLAKHKRFWHAFGFFEKVVSAILFLMMMYMLIVAVIALPRTLSSGSSIGIEYALAIPGFNPIMPLSYGIVALIVAMVVHELAHGIQSRVNGIRVEASGLLYGVVPLGAFVEPNEEELTRAPRKARIDVYAAGITVNTIVAILSILIMVGACGCVSSDYEDNVGAYYIDKGSPANTAGIPASALITGVAVYETSGLSDYSDVVADVHGTAAYLDYGFDPTKTYSLRYQYKDATYETGPVQMGAYIKTVSKDSPADDAGFRPGSFIHSITIDGTETLIGGPHDFTEAMKGTHPGQTVSVSIVASGSAEAVSYDVVLDSNGSKGFLGVACTTGGMTFTTPGILLDAAANPFYGAEGAYGHVQSFFSYLSGPFNGMDPISDEIQWWYDAPGDDAFWICVRMLYWLFWLDILLAISNALPTRVLDGGYIFSGGVSWLLERLRVGDEARREELTESITGSVSTVTLFLFVLVIVAMVV